MDIFSLNAQQEKAILDSMVADIRFTGNAMKKQMPDQNQVISGGLFNGKKLFDAMEMTTKKELEEFTSAIQNNTKTIVSEIDGLMAMDVAHQILDKIGNNVLTR